ncbi:MAG: hypothetical protein P1P82_10015 [Bacteroidales bacterium]|nr:hypothetical protein [Bacteroidales bacterium]MDT8431277.1 hypothetical protein [Bacteroidales bacterium]
MRITRKILLLLAAILPVLCSCDRLEREVYENADGRFVRFNLQIDKDGKQVQFGEVNPAADVVSFYEQKTVSTLAIPVTITSEPLQEKVEVTFSVDTVGGYDAFVVEPADGVLEFEGNRLTDTIYIDYLSRWEGDGDSQIMLALESISDDSIMIGHPNNVEKNDKLTISLQELNLRYYLPVMNTIEILGEAGEEVLLVVSFPDGLFPDELEEVALLVNLYTDFEYSLECLPVDDDALEVVYILTLEEAVDNDVLSFSAQFELADIENYQIAGNSTLTIIKPVFVLRDNTVNTAAHFYNVDDPLYRTYGENWMDSNEDDTCSWQSFNAFTYPVIVPADHPNAVLGDDGGNDDPADDVYYHAFRIGFNSPNAGNTTNSFNLKRWFNNESLSGEYSSGFNVTQALEFFPDDGTSAVSGMVKVIPQDLMISTRVETDVYRSYTIAIEGEGEYVQIADGVYEITLELRATNAELFGGTRTAKYKIWNTDDYDDPVDIGESCFQPMDL